MKSIYSTIVFRDVISRYNLRNTFFLEKLIQCLSENTGSLFPAKNICDYLKSQYSTISVNQIQSILLTYPKKSGYQLYGSRLKFNE